MARATFRSAALDLAGRDPVLAGLVEEFGPPRLRPPQETHFAALVRSIAFQQLAGAAAAAIHGRLVVALDGEVTPEAVLRLPDTALRGAGLSGAKAASITDLAVKTLDGTVVLDPPGLARESDDEVVARLSTVRGIGRWTAEMFLLFQLRRLDVWPTGDLGVRQGYGHAYGVGTPTPKELEVLGDRFRPYRSVVAWYCWRAVDREQAARLTPVAASPEVAWPARAVGWAMLVATLLVAGACSPGRAHALPLRPVPVTAPAPWSPGVHDVFESWGGHVRHARVVVPTTAPSGQRHTLIIALHGVGGNGAQIEADSRFDTLAGPQGYVVAYPDGVGQTWNAGTCCFTAVDEAVDDVGYVGHLVAEISTRLPIESGRVYVAGFSNGAMLGYRMACESSGLVAAVASVAGTLAVSAPCRPSRPVPVLEIHGRSDALVAFGRPFNGQVGGQRTRLVESSATATVALWMRLDHCPAPTVTVLGPGAYATSAIAGPCAGGATVAFYAVSGGHDWPGSPSAGPTGSRPDATSLILAFFAAHQPG